MAEMDTTGLDELMLSLEEVADLPDEVVLEMLQAEGQVLREAQIRSIQSTFGPERTHQLEQSLTVDEKLRTGWTGAAGRYLLLAPKGNRKEGPRNAEVAFIQEFGAPRRGIRATQWMRLANEGAAEQAVNAAAQVYDRYLEDHNL